MTRRQIIAQPANVGIAFPGADGALNTVVDGLSLTIHSGERIGLIGASGSGKSLTALSLLGLVPSPGSVVRGSVQILGVDMLSDSLSDKQRLRGGAVGLVFQEAESALNPVLTIGTHLKEVILRHRPSEGSRWREIAVDFLKKVDLQPVRILKSYPHHLSGGQRQRVLLAIALSTQPDLIIADEPTSSLDVLTQARVLTLLDRLCRDDGLALLLISHDIGVVSSLVDRVIVMLAGRIVEEAPMRAFLAEPLHPYSKSLVTNPDEAGSSMTQPSTNPNGQSGCAFANQCPLSTPECEKILPEMTVLRSGRALRCPIVARVVAP